MRIPAKKAYFCVDCECFGDVAVCDCGSTHTIIVAGIWNRDDVREFRDTPSPAVIPLLGIVE